MSSYWCPDYAICIEWIERRALELFENFQPVDTVYMSWDVYEQFLKSMNQKMRFSSSSSGGTLTITQIMTSIGPLTVKPILHFSNFCFIGTTATYEQLEWEMVGQAFEEAFLKDCEREE